ncbi:MAG: hypothetical protein ACR2J8_12250, partial [Thermomicrobiales bacterium]
MDHLSFDRLARVLGASSTRRAGLRALLAATLGAAASTPADARRDHHAPRPEGPCGDGSRKDNICTKNSQCCTGFCNTAIKNADGKGRCRCVKKGKPCKKNTNCCHGSCIAGVCTPGVPTGDPCTLSSTCADPAATCAPYTSGTPAGTYCLLPNDAACVSGSQCASQDCASGVCVPCSCGGCAGSCTVTVCPTCAVTSIQTAITSASPGAVIGIGAGTYLENLIIDRTITLRACDGPNTAIVRNVAYGNRTITITNGSSLDLIDLTVDGYASYGNANYGGGIATNGNLTLCRSTTVRNAGWDNGGGILIETSGVTLHVTDHALIEDNKADNGAGIRFTGESDLVIDDYAIIRNNTSINEGGGVLATDGAN